MILSQSSVSAIQKDVPAGEDARSTAQVKNDARVLDYAKKRVVRLEQELKAAQADIKILQGRPSLSTQREVYVLSEMDDSNRQLEGIKYVDLFFACV